MASNNASKYFNFVNTVIKNGASNYEPWDVIITKENGGNYTYQLIPSTINGVVPNNFTDIWSGNTSSEKYLYLSVSTTSGRITSVSFNSSPTPTESPAVLQSLPPSSFDVAIGVIGTDGIYYKFVNSSPIVATPEVSFESDRSPPVPGLSPRIQWWTWVITQ